MMKRSGMLISSLAAGCLLVFADSVAVAAGSVNIDRNCGATCCYTVPSKEESGDAWYGADNWDWCRPDWLKSAADAYGLEHDDWPGDSWGWNDACNTDMPLARLFTAIVALDSSSYLPIEDPNYSRHDIIEWGRHYAAEQIDDTDARCTADYASDTTARCVNCNRFLGIHLSRSLTLFQPQFFYGMDVPTRAAILVHEAWHWGTGAEHTSASGGTKDASFSHGSDAGAYSVTVWFLSRYAKEAVNAPDVLRCTAQDDANDVLSNSFENAPDVSERVDLSSYGVTCL